MRNNDETTDKKAKEQEKMKTKIFLPIFKNHVLFFSLSLFFRYLFYIIHLLYSLKLYESFLMLLELIAITGKHYTTSKKQANDNRNKIYIIITS